MAEVNEARWNARTHSIDTKPASRVHSCYWRLVYDWGESNEPEHDVSIRENPPNARALLAVTWDGRIIRAIDLERLWTPVWYRCRSFIVPSLTRCIVFGRALPLDDGVRVEIEAIYKGRWLSEVPPEYIDEGAIATQTLRLKG